MASIARSQIHGCVCVDLFVCAEQAYTLSLYHSLNISYKSFSSLIYKYLNVVL